MRATPIWILNLVLALIALTLFLRAPTPPEPHPRTEQPTASVDIPLAPIPPLYSYEAITSRPLFSPDRRPVPPPEPATTDLPDEPEMEPPPKASPPVPPEARLHGVIGDGTSWVALVQDTGDTAPRRFSTGDRLGTWRIEEITPQAILLQSGDTQFRIPLRPKPSTQ